MRRLFEAGFALIPLGGGDDGKSPAVAFNGRRRLPLAVVEKRMRALGSSMYGIRLQGLVVVDLDTETPEATAYLEHRFGGSTVRVRTRRGWHHWFRLDKAAVPGNVREPGIAIDLKSGQNSYVVGPGSVRPDGTIYEYAGAPLDRVKGLPPFIDRMPPGSRSPSRFTGGRHDFLLKHAIQYAATCDSEEEILGNLVALREYELEDPATIPDSEIAGIAAWAWGKRLENSLWGGRENSVVKIPREAIITLGKREHGAEALCLLCVLQSAHGHIDGKTFVIVAGAMVRDGLLPFGEKPTRRAVRTLIEEGYLIRLPRRGGYDQPHRYQLARGRRLHRYIIGQSDRAEVAA